MLCTLNLAHPSLRPLVVAICGEKGSHRSYVVDLVSQEIAHRNPSAPVLTRKMSTIVKKATALITGTTDAENSSEEKHDVVVDFFDSPLADVHNSVDAMFRAVLGQDVWVNRALNDTCQGTEAWETVVLGGPTSVSDALTIHRSGALVLWIEDGMNDHADRVRPGFCHVIRNTGRLDALQSDVKRALADLGVHEEIAQRLGDRRPPTMK
jgi:hypothetical protein